MRASIAVALIDALGIGLGLWVLDVPLVLPLAVILAVAAGGSQAGVIGAVLAVPLVTTVRAFLSIALQPRRPSAWE